MIPMKELVGYFDKTYANITKVQTEDGRDITEWMLPHLKLAESRAILLELALTELVGWHNLEPLLPYVEYPQNLDAYKMVFDWREKIVHKVIGHHDFEEELNKDLFRDEFRQTIDRLVEKCNALADAELRLHKLTGETVEDSWLCPVCGSEVEDWTTSSPEYGTEYDAGCPICGESFDEDRWIPGDPAALKQRLLDIYEYWDTKEERRKISLVVENARLRRELAKHKDTQPYCSVIGVGKMSGLTWDDYYPKSYTYKNSELTKISKKIDKAIKKLEKEAKA